jgi:hypothetical protein
MRLAKVKKWATAALLSLAASLFAPVRSTTLAPMTFEELARRATAIVHVRCLGSQSAWSGGEIWTDSRFEVVEKWKADPAAPAGQNIIVVRQLGGTLGGLHSHVEGVPQFAAGEEDCLFLWRRGDEPYRVLGWSQGTFRVARDPHSGTARVTQDSALSAFHAEGREFQSTGVRNLTLAAFQRNLQQALDAVKQ